MASYTTTPAVLDFNEPEPVIAPADFDRSNSLPTKVDADAGCLLAPDDSVQSDEPSLYRYGTDKLRENDENWMKDNIKINDALDTGDGGTPSNGACPVAGAPKKVSTDAFGQIFFVREEVPGWFVHMSSDTSIDILQELIEKKLELLKFEKPLRIHFIDYDCSPWPETKKKIVTWSFLASFGPHKSKKQQDNIQMKSLDEISNRLGKDIRSVCRRTPGLVMTWSGLREGPGNYVHVALEKLFANSEENTENFASISFPPWKLLDERVKEKMRRQVSERPQNERVLLKRPSVPTTDTDIADNLGTSVSTAATHFLLLDPIHQTESPGSDELQATHELRDCRRFQRSLIGAMDRYKESKEMPVVCILIGGGPDSLKMVRFAQDSNIPVLLLKGTGGAADALADVYMKADLATIKERDEKEKVRTRSMKIPGAAGNECIQLFGESDPAREDLEYIFKRLDRLTVYCPTLALQSLDSVIFEALFKHRQKEKIAWLVSIMKQMRARALLTISTSHKAFIDSQALQMDFFIEAVKQDFVDIVTLFLDTLDISHSFKHQFHLGRILRLYTEDTSKCLRMIDIRRDLQKHLKKLTVFPLRCLCEQCCSCSVETNTNSPEVQLKNQRTCLHPMQELFLWAVQACQTDLAVVFWTKCDDKIAAALVAQAVFRSKAKSEKDLDKRRQKEDDMECFQQLAINTLKSCHDLDETETESLLTKPCPWWAGVSILQLAIITGNKAFIAQSACKNVMTRIWRGDPPAKDMKDPLLVFHGDSSGSECRPTHLVDIKPEAGCGSWACCPPWLKYSVNVVLQVAFLMLFSYTLLSDFGHTLTPAFIALIIWVASITVEEIRQFVDRNPVTSEVRLAQQQVSCNIKRKWKAYWSQFWNHLDFATVGLFWLGMLAFADNTGVHIFGRILLSIDIFLFFMRTFQMLMVFEELGLLLVMVYKMVKDTINFMIILLVFVVAYAVASEAILYPESEITWARLFHLPRKAYWQVFGELLLEEIEPAGQGEDGCSSGNSSLHFGGDIPPCSTDYGRHVVPILLGLYIVITNVLLLNLLIARFNVTFNKVHDEAVEYQSWHRCEIITEFYSRTSLPPPFNILHFVLRACRWLVQTFCCFCSSCCNKRKDGTCCKRGKDWDEAMQKLMADEKAKVVCMRSADRRSIDVFWNRRLVPSKEGVYTVLVEDGIEVNSKINSIYGRQVSGASLRSSTRVRDGFQVKGVPLDEFKLAETEKDLHALSVWGLDPSKSYKIKVENFAGTDKWDTSTTWDSESLCKIHQFEENQALWVLRHENVDKNPVLREVRESSTFLINGLTQLGKDLGESLKNKMGDLKEQVKNLSHDLEQYKNSVSSSLDGFDDLKKKIKGNLQKIANYIDEGQGKQEVEKKAFIKHFDKMNAQLDNFRSEASVAASQMEEMRQIAMESRLQASSAVSQMVEQVEELKQMVMESRSQAREVVSQMEEMKQVVMESRSQARAAESQMEEMKQVVMESRSQARAAESQMEEFKQMVIESRSQARTTEAQMEEMKQMLVQMMEQQKQQQQ